MASEASQVRGRRRTFQGRITTGKHSSVLLADLLVRKMISNLKQIAAAAMLGVMMASLAVLPVSGTPAPSQSPAAAEGPTTPPSFSAPLNQRQKAELLLRRITFGPRPGDVERVEETGLNNFLIQQLHPRTLYDSAVEARLTNIETLAMPATKLAEDVREAQRRQKERRLAMLNQQGAMGARSAAEAGPLRPGFRRFGATAPPQAGPDGEAAQAPAPAPANEPAPAMNDTSQTNGDSFFPPREILTQLGQEELLRAVY
ncbi:MAG: DUF1800 family protein, partial [Acidobacteriota bacterium]|nr:DUF1800 family protein [Acidobacteriota bacterium]